MMSSSVRSKRLAWMVLLLVMLTGSAQTLWMATPVVMAQDEEPAAEEPAEEKPAKKAKKGDDKKEEAAHTEESFVWWVIKTSGPIGAVLLGLSIYFVNTATRLFIELRPIVAMPPDLMEDIKQKMEKKDYKGVYASVKEKDCLFTRYVTSGLGELSSGLAEAREAMGRISEVQTSEMEKKISMLAVLGTLGPMIGLLGTLQGMIGSFSVIARSDTQLKASEVAHGISEALLLTFEGVALSVPAIYFFAVFKNRISSITGNTMLQADEFVRKLANAAKSAAAPKAAAPAAAAQAPPAAPKA